MRASKAVPGVRGSRDLQDPMGTPGPRARMAARARPGNKVPRGRREMQGLMGTQELMAIQALLVYRDLPALWEVLALQALPARWASQAQVARPAHRGAWEQLEPLEIRVQSVKLAQVDLPDRLASKAHRGLAETTALWEPLAPQAT